MQIIPMQTLRVRQFNGLGNSLSSYLDQPLPYMLFTEIPSDLENKFESALPDIAKQYGPDMIKASKETGVSPLLMAGIAWAETLIGTSQFCGTRGPACTSKTGKYLGLMQYSDLLVPWVRQKLPNGRPKWSVPYYNFRGGGEVLVQTRNEMVRRVRNRGTKVSSLDPTRLGNALIAGYNKGGGPATTVLLSGGDIDSITDKYQGIGYVTRVMGMVNAISDAMKSGTQVNIANV